MITSLKRSRDIARAWISVTSAETSYPNVGFNNESVDIIVDLDLRG